MSDMDLFDDTDLPADDEAGGEGTSILLSDPDITMIELQAVAEALQAPRLSSGPTAEAFEAAFAGYLGRKYAVAVPSGTLGLLYTLKAYGIGPGDEVICSPHSFRETVHAVSLSGARPVFADIDYWAGTLVPEKAAAKITEKTKAIVAGNSNGHPAPWTAFQELARTHKLALIEDSTEAIGSRYKGALVGSFGDTSVFDFSQPFPLVCGEGGMVVTDDIDVAVGLRRFRAHRLDERSSVVVSMSAPYQGAMSDVTAALGLAQLGRLEEILEQRHTVEHLYQKYVQSFEGIKDPFIGPDVTEVNWFLYVVHLGTRFSKSSRDAIVDDLKVEKVESAAYSAPLHLQRHYFDLGYRKGDFLVTEKVADRAIALPFHTHLSEDEIEFIVATMKDASINVGAGAAIY
ncbi:DegT/DnrJ/EryC1/StrS family aminotransferase [Xanthobacter oligotrophicus]|uniref:DegT/DnrJ/EryC1/StrS family aminotransferase n=1 Tax=Xanthobacter oligotrophicus TaxID=2607286 RepID=A0ABW7A1Z9_9HYPH